MLHKCNKCHIEYEYTQDNFYQQNGRLRKVCKKCVDEYNRLNKKIKPCREVEYEREVYINKRLKLGISQFKAASLIGISYQTLTNIEQGKNRTANIKTIEKLNKFYKIG